MKTRKVLSFILMVALLIAMSITPGFATHGSGSGSQTKLTLEYNKEGGTVTANAYTFKKEPCDRTEHKHGDGKCVYDFTQVVCRNQEHTHEYADKKRRRML